MTGWPHDDSPQPIVPTQVWHRDDLWEVDHVDVLGRWFLVSEHDDYYEERYADPAEISFTVRDARPEVGVWVHSAWSRLLDAEMKQAAEQLKRDWEHTLGIYTLLQK